MPKSLTPFLMFEGDAEAAMRLYEAIFEGAEIVELDRYGAGEDGPEGTVRKGVVRIAGQTVICFDSPAEHAFGFTPAVSLFVECASPEEVDAACARLADCGAVLMPAGEYPFSQRFGWVNDRFGVSWQLIS